MATREINQAIGSVQQFGYLLEDGFNVLEANILLGGVLNDDGEIIENATYCEGDTSQFGAEKPWYRVTSAYEKDGLVMVNAELLHE